MAPLGALLLVVLNKRVVELVLACILLVVIFFNTNVQWGDLPARLQRGLTRHVLSKTVVGLPGTRFCAAAHADRTIPVQSCTCAG